MNFRSSFNQAHALILAPTWPSATGGFGIALRASLLLYLEIFSTVNYICISDQFFEASEAWPNDRIEWTHVPTSVRPKWIRFLRSLSGTLPAITIRYACAHRGVMRALTNALYRSGGNTYLIFEDIAMACLLSSVVRKFPKIPIAIRSHNMTEKAFEPFCHLGSPLQRLAWRLELAKIRRFERKACERADKVWAISPTDAEEYNKRMFIQPDGVLGVCMDVKRYRGIGSGNTTTAVSVGTINLRKEKGILDFIHRAWPTVRAKIPEARFVLAGRGTDRFIDVGLAVDGLGFVDDDRDILGQGLIFVNPQQIGAGVQLKSIAAMLAGKALVSSRMGVAGVEGKSGEHFVVAESMEDMATHIVSLMRCPERALEIGENAKRLAAKNYNVERLLEASRPLLNDFICGFYKEPKFK